MNKTLITSILGCAVIVGTLVYMAEASYPVAPEITALTKKGNGQRSDRVSESETTVTVHDGYGGWTSLYIEAARYVLRSNKQLRIGRYCYSGCTIMADTVRRHGGRVCVQEDTQFGFHKARDNNNQYHRPTLYYSTDIMTWVDQNGGWPEGNRFTLMSGEALWDLFPLCTEGER